MSAETKPPIPIPPVADAPARKAPGLFSQLFDRVPLQEKIKFARHLALVIKAGLPIFAGLTIIKGQTESKVLRRIIDDLAVDVNNGRFLADGLQRYEYVFGGFFINIVRVGEASGTLSQNLLYLAEELRRSSNLQGKVRSAMVYPIVILFATIGVSAFLTFFVFPKLIPVFAGLNIQLPFTTRALLAIIAFLKAYGAISLGAIIVFAIVVRLLFHYIKAVRYAFDAMILYIPVLDNVIIAVNMVNFTRVLALLLKSGMKIVESIDITAATFGNLIYVKALQDANEEIKKGGQLGAYIEKRKHFFPPLISGMINVGEETGSLEENLGYLAEYYDDEVDNRLRSLTALIEPLMLLIMGLLVGFIALSIITPIYSISQGIK